VDEDDDQEIEVHKVDPASERRKIDRLREVKTSRDQEQVRVSLERLARTAEDSSADLMPATIDAVKANASMGEIVRALEPGFGRYRETPVF
jgi:methylmalonyl-CoA mutase N-terminal domain/subunit